MENYNESQLADKLFEALKKAAIEIEELQLQATLGKAEALDIYEDVKKRFDTFIHESKMKYDAGKEKVDDFFDTIEKLRLQLALGKADTIDMFKEQKKRILKLLRELESKIKSNETLQKIYALVLIQIEIFKVHLESIEKSLEKGKEEALKAFQEGNETFKKFIDKLLVKSGIKKETKLEKLQSEFSDAFDDLIKSFSF